MRRVIFTITAALAVAACTPSETTTAETAATQFIGKQLVAENGTVFLFGADGSVGGTIGGDPIVGTYTADQREICSTYTAPERLAGSEFCSVPQVSGTQVIFNRRDGSQSQPYEIMG